MSNNYMKPVFQISHHLPVNSLEQKQQQIQDVLQFHIPYHVEQYLSENAPDLIPFLIDQINSLSNEIQKMAKMIDGLSKENQQIVREFLILLQKINLKQDNYKQEIEIDDSFQSSIDLLNTSILSAHDILENYQNKPINNYAIRPEVNQNAIASDPYNNSNSNNNFFSFSASLAHSSGKKNEFSPSYNKNNLDFQKDKQTELSSLIQQINMEKDQISRVLARNFDEDNQQKSHPGNSSLDYSRKQLQQLHSSRDPYDFLLQKKY